MCCVVSFSTPRRVHLVCSFLSVCLFHFHAPDWFKLNCPSCCYLTHPQWLYTNTQTHMQIHDARYVHTYHTIVVQLSTSTAATLSFVKCLESQLLYVWMCVYVWIPVFVCLHVHLSYLQWGEWAKATESICSNVRNLVLTQITGDKRGWRGYYILME